MHLSNLYPQWGGVDPRRCYWSCITSSCMCHPTKTAPSTAYHNVATSLTPLEGVIDAPCCGEHFLILRFGDTIFAYMGCTCDHFGANFRQGSTFFCNFFKISKYIVISTPNWSFPPSNYGRRNFRHLSHEQITGNRACRLGQAAGTGGKSTSWLSFSFLSQIISGPPDL